MANDRAKLPDTEPPKDKRQANINSHDLQQGHSDSPIGTSRPDLNKLGFPSSNNFDNLMAYAGEEPGQKQSKQATTSDKTKLREKLSAHGKSAEKLSPLIDLMPHIKDIQLGSGNVKKDANNLSVRIGNENTSKVSLAEENKPSMVLLKSVEFGKEVKFTANADGKLTNISGIRVNCSVPVDEDFRIGGPIARQPFSTNLQEATIEREDGKDYLNARIAPYAEHPDVTYSIHIPLKNEPNQEKTNLYPDAEYPRLTLKQIIHLAEANIKAPTYLDSFKKDLQDFDAIAKKNGISEKMIEKAYGQWARFLQYQGGGRFSKTEVLRTAANRLHEFAEPTAKYLQTEDFVMSLKNEAGLALQSQK